MVRRAFHGFQYVHSMMCLVLRYYHWGSPTLMSSQFYDLFILTCYYATTVLEGDMSYALLM